MRKLLQLSVILFIAVSGFSQDSLRGSITAERAWWDVIKYDITVEPDIIEKTIRGTNVITFKAISSGKRMQIDMQEPMKIEKANAKNHPLSFSRDRNVYYLQFNKTVKKGEVITLCIEYNGRPHEAVTPPWDGGWIWKSDKTGNPWVTVACQGLGASSWYPCKDHQSDEPDSATLSIIVPDSLIGIGNGRLRSSIRAGKGKTKYEWAVTNPINSYNIVPYIGKYVNWSDKYQGEKGVLDISYWAIAEDEKRARLQFEQVPKMLQCFEYWFGPYPFYEDGYKLVQAPHLGMEHQSAIAYGNQFANGYLGTDLSGTGWGEKWDFIIVHESGHEWFGNNITTDDIADMWVHEGFTNYSEVLFTQCEFGKEAGNAYATGLRKNIKNDKPVIGEYGLNREGSIDMYYKGSALVHMIRQIMGDDEDFRRMLRGLNKTFYHNTVTAAEVLQFINKTSGKKFDKVFEQYLTTTLVPELQYKIENGKLQYRWSNCVKNFDMPVKVKTDEVFWLHPTTEWKEIAIKNNEVSIDGNFYVGSRKM